MEIRPYDQFTKEDLITILKQYEVQKAGQAERLRAIEKELLRRDDVIERAVRAIGTPNLYAQDSEKMIHWLIELESAFRPMIEVVGVRYGIQDYCYKKNADPVKLEMARIFRDIISYFDWDDK